MQPPVKPVRRADGCGFIVLSCVFVCCALLMNSALVAVVYESFKPLLPGELQKEKWGQLIVFATPILLIFMQWWMFDRFVDYVTPNGEEE